MKPQSCLHTEHVNLISKQDYRVMSQFTLYKQSNMLLFQSLYQDIDLDSKWRLQNEKFVKTDLLE